MTSKATHEDVGTQEEILHFFGSTVKASMSIWKVCFACTILQHNSMIIVMINLIISSTHPLIATVLTSGSAFIH